MSPVGADSDVSHLPYRESRLTRILQSSLGGNSRTSIICTLSPSAANVSQSMGTLRFGTRAICIQNKARVNTVAEHKAHITQHKIEMENLRKRLSTFESREEVDEVENSEADKTPSPVKAPLPDVETESIRLELKAQLERLKGMILRSTSCSQRSEDDLWSLDGNDRQQAERRRHTFGATPSKSLKLSRGDADSRSGKKNTRFATYNPLSQPDDFSVEMTRDKNLQLERLVRELSDENSRLLEAQAEAVEREREVSHSIVARRERA